MPLFSHVNFYLLFFRKLVQDKSFRVIYAAHAVDPIETPIPARSSTFEPIARLLPDFSHGFPSTPTHFRFPNINATTLIQISVAHFIIHDEGIGCLFNLEFGGGLYLSTYLPTHLPTCISTCESTTVNAAQSETHERCAFEAFTNQFSNQFKNPLASVLCRRQERRRAKALDASAYYAPNLESFYSTICLQCITDKSKCRCCHSMVQARFTCGRSSRIAYGSVLYGGGRSDPLFLL